MGLFKKNKDKKPSKDEKGILSAVEESEPEIDVHVMPKKFLHIHKEVNKAKGIGILILIIGVLAIIGAFAVLYFYVLAPKQPATDKKAQPTEENTNKPIEKPDEPEPIEEPEPDEPEPIEEPEPATTTQPMVLKTAPDTDGDMVTDVEETIFGCRDKPKDCDEDTYPDLGEMLKGYDPASDKKLIDNPNISEYMNSAENYKIIYPNIFKAEKINGDESIMIKLDNKQFIQILVGQVEETMTLEEWYKEQFDISIINAAQLVNSGDLKGIKSEDGLTYYFKKSNDNNLYTITYNIGLTDTLYYKNIFQAMINSFEVDY